MKAVELKKLSGAQWDSYGNLVIDIRRKFGENCLLDDGDWHEFRDFYPVENIELEKFKTKRLGILEERKSQFLNEYVVLNEDAAVAWTAHKIYEDRCEFLFDTIYDDIPVEMIKAILNAGRDFIKKSGKDVLHHWTHDQRKAAVFAEIGVEPSWNGFKSRLSKSDMNVNYWKELVESKNADNLRLVFCNEIPEESYKNYVDFLNEIILDKEMYNPDNPVPTKATIEGLIRKIELNREDIDPFYIYLLYDGSEIAAVCSLYVEQSDKIPILNHNGGLTAVSRKHRGKNLAKYLKAKMYLKVLEDYSDIEYILTDTYPWNKYMYRINEELGFKPYRNESNYEFSKEHLERIV